MNNTYLELKNDFYDALIEVELQDVNDKKLNTLKYNILTKVSQNIYEINETIRVNTKINESNLKGWIKGIIHQIKGEFYLISLSNSVNSSENKKIFHKSEIRKYEEVIQEIHISQKKSFDLRNLFLISKEVNVALIVKKFRSMKGCILCKYNSPYNTLIVFGTEEFLQLSDRLMVIIEKHYSNISQQTENVPESKKISKVQHQSLTLNKNIYDLVKSKVESFKKQYSMRFDTKQKKDNKVLLEWDYKDEKINDLIVSELSLNEYYFENLKLPQEFFKTDSYPSFNHYLDKFKSGIEYYNIFPVDEKTYNLNIIGKESILLKLNVILTNMVSHYQICSEKDSELKLISNEIDELGRKYGRILGN